MGNSEKECCGSGKCECKCPCHNMTGIMVAVFGLVFFLKAIGIISEASSNIAWPITIIIGGLTSVCKGMCGCCKKKEEPKT